ncbi:MAG TPA: amidohydrolase family protein [Propionibacteriaceae bacterium]|nr:amidohydrolase family protein [Propionibacteriaceae bacterium]
MGHSHDHLPGFVHTHTHDGHTHSHLQPQGIDLAPGQALHLQGHVLPEGDVRDLWISDGIIHTEPIPGALTLATGVWIMPGLVDAHCHVGLNADGPVDAATAETQALADRDAGTLLIRDAGSPSDTRWIDERDDLPRIIRAGRHIARPRRYIRNFADEVEPDDLVATVEKQVANGDGWVKLVGDWIDRDAGDLTPLWPQDVAAQAIERAHELGARVTAHCFDGDSASQLVAAGIDGIEHGTGLDGDTIAVMAERQVALVPTMINIENFPAFAAAGEEKFPLYAAHIRDMYARFGDTLEAAHEAGVPIFAGTDAGGVMPHGLLGHEIEQLATVAGPDFALGAASWRAREWLGMPGVEEGASADLVVFAEDPRVHLGILRHPLAVILRGRLVLGS